MQYSEKFKERTVKRLLGPGAVSATALSREVGVPQPTLSKWLRASLAGVSRNDQGGSQKPVRERMSTATRFRGISSRTTIMGRVSPSVVSETGAAVGGR